VFLVVVSYLLLTFILMALGNLGIGETCSPGCLDESALSNPLTELGRRGTQRPHTLRGHSRTLAQVGELLCNKCGIRIATFYPRRWLLQRHPGRNALHAGGQLHGMATRTDRFNVEVGDSLRPIRITCALPGRKRNDSRRPSTRINLCSSPCVDLFTESCMEETDSRWVGRQERGAEGAQVLDNQRCRHIDGWPFRITFASCIGGSAARCSDTATVRLLCLNAHFTRWLSLQR
jgi:hypothetical protein